jgi:hypothetical protein
MYLQSKGTIPYRPIVRMNVSVEAIEPKDSRP